MGNGQAGVTLRRVGGAPSRTLEAAERERGGYWPTMSVEPHYTQPIPESLPEVPARPQLRRADDRLTNGLPLLDEDTAPFHTQASLRKQLHGSWIDGVLLL
jgi:hypothetical protein